MSGPPSSYSTHALSIARIQAIGKRTQRLLHGVNGPPLSHSIEFGVGAAWQHAYFTDRDHRQSGGSGERGILVCACASADLRRTSEAMGLWRGSDLITFTHHMRGVGQVDEVGGPGSTRCDTRARVITINKERF